MGGTHSRADGPTRRPNIYRGREVGTQCVDKVVKVYMWWGFHVTGTGGQPGEVYSMSLNGRNVGMNKVMTLDRLR